MFKSAYIFILISGLLLTSCNTELTTATQPADENRTNQLAASNGFSFQGINVPTEVMLQVFSLLPVTDIVQGVTSEKGIYSTLRGNNYICEMSG